MTAATAGYLDTNGARISYEVDGTGEPVLLIHAGVANLRMWDGQVVTLRDAFRVIRHDTRGFGQTETHAVEFSNHLEQPKRFNRALRSFLASNAATLGAGRPTMLSTTAPE